MYTHHIYQEINEALRKGVLTPEQQNYVNVLNRALDKLNPEFLYVYRGVNNMPADVLQKYIDAFNNGTEVTEKHFTSSSINLKTAEEYAGDGVLFYIKSKTVRNIMKLSKWGDEEGEMLFRSGTKFKVSRVEKVGVLHVIEMEEV